MALITVEEAARRLGLKRGRVYVLIAEGRLPAVKPGRDWMIEEADLERPEVKERKSGYPKGRPRREWHGIPLEEVRAKREERKKGEGEKEAEPEKDQPGD